MPRCEQEPRERFLPDGGIPCWRMAADMSAHTQPNLQPVCLALPRGITACFSSEDLMLAKLFAFKKIYISNTKLMRSWSRGEQREKQWVNCVQPDPLIKSAGLGRFMLSENMVHLAGVSCNYCHMLWVRF